MLFQINRILLTVLGCLILLSLTDKQHILKAGEIYPKSDTTKITESKRRIGYRDVVLFKDNYVAVGTDGRIDSFSKSGEKEPIDNTSNSDLNCAFSNGEIMIPWLVLEKY